MTDRLLKKRELAAMLGTSPGVAVSIMLDHGIAPIDWGAGRSRGYRWPESKVKDVILQMYAAAQPKKKRTPKPQAIHIPLAEMSPADIHKLTTCQRVH